MPFGHWLQIVGAVFELLGLLTVAIGISKTRARFTDEPSLPDRLWAGTKRLAGRVAAHFGYRRDATVKTAKASAFVSVGGKARGTVMLGPGDDVELEERIERMRQMVNDHSERLSKLDVRIDQEQEDRQSGDELAEQQRQELRRELKDLIGEAAAGGLRLETAGAILFALGISFGAWGNLVS
jgi:hypothetical protein